MQLEGMAIFCSIGTVSASVLVDVCVAFTVTVQHAFVDARVVALVAFIRFGVVVIPYVVLEVVFILRHKFALGTSQHSLGFHVGF